MTPNVGQTDKLASQIQKHASGTCNSVTYNTLNDTGVGHGTLAKQRLSHAMQVTKSMFMGAILKRSISVHDAI